MDLILYLYPVDLECGPPAQVPNGHYTLINGTRGYQSMVRYSCEEGHVMVGRSDLMCDIDQKWNGPPPRCEPLVCPDPPQILNGFYTIEADAGENLYVVHYECDAQYNLVGPKAIVCSEGVYDQPPPVCREAETNKRPAGGAKIPATSSSSSRPSTHNSTIITTTFKSTSSATNKPNLIAQPGYGDEQEPHNPATGGAAEEEDEDAEDRYDPNAPQHETPQYEDEHYADGGDLGYLPDNGLDHVPSSNSNNEDKPSSTPTNNNKPLVEEVLNNEVAQESVNNIIKHAKPIQNQAELPKSVEAKTKHAGGEPRNLSKLAVPIAIIIIISIQSLHCGQPKNL